MADKPYGYSSAAEDGQLKKTLKGNEKSTAAKDALEAEKKSLEKYAKNRGETLSTKCKRA
jgi:ABC-type uncharacterized transport system YnjBCD ATPase subunit